MLPVSTSQSTVDGPLIDFVASDRDDVVEFLYDRQEDMSKWNPTVNDCRVIISLNQMNFDWNISILDIKSDQSGFVYSVSDRMTNEQAQGIIGKRDFVNITTRRFIDDVAILAAQACNYPQMPIKDNCVRGENGPTGYIIEKIDGTSCRFTCLNLLWGWLPQYLINSSLANAQLTFAESLRTYLSNTIDMLSSCSSSIGDTIT